MKRLFFIHFILLFFSTEIFAYEVNVHEKITKNATTAANIELYLNNNFNMSLSNRLGNKTALEWMADGSRWEDATIDTSSSMRFMNHFYDPTTQLGFNVGGIAVGDAVSSLVWAKGHVNNLYNWSRTRGAYYQALTSANPNDRNVSYAVLFRSLGHLIHLVHDKAVPAHVRNDPHFPYLNSILGEKDLYENYTTILSDCEYEADKAQIDRMKLTESMEDRWAPKKINHQKASS